MPMIRAIPSQEVVLPQDSDKLKPSSMDALEQSINPASTLVQLLDSAIRFWPVAAAVLIGFMYLLGAVATNAKQSVIGLPLQTAEPKETTILAGGSVLMQFIVVAVTLSGAAMMLRLVIRRVVPRRLAQSVANLMSRIRNYSRAGTVAFAVAMLVLYMPGGFDQWLDENTRDLLFGAVPPPDSLVAQIFLDSARLEAGLWVSAICAVILAAILLGVFAVRRVIAPTLRRLCLTFLLLMWCLAMISVADIVGVLYSTNAKLPIVAFENEEQLLGQGATGKYLIALLGETDKDFVLYVAPIQRESDQERRVLWLSKSDHHWVVSSGTMNLFAIAFYHDWLKKYKVR